MLEKKEYNCVQRTRAFEKWVESIFRDPLGREEDKDYEYSSGSE